MVYSLNPNTAIYATFTAASAQIAGLTIGANERWMIVTDAAVMIAQGAAPTAAKANGSMLVFPGAPLIVDGRSGAKLATFQAGGSTGQVTVTRLMDT